MKHTTILLLTIFFTSSIEAQYMPADSIYYKLQPHPVYELDARLDRLELGVEKFERQARLGKYLLLTGTTTMLLGSIAVNQNPGNLLGWFASFSGSALSFAGTVVMMDAPVALRAAKDRKKRRVD
jgi:hypothetical protein